MEGRFHNVKDLRGWARLESLMYCPCRFSLAPRRRNTFLPTPSYDAVNAAHLRVLLEFLTALTAWANRRPFLHLAHRKSPLSVASSPLHACSSGGGGDITIPFKSGDVVFFRSCVLEHFIAPFEGTRTSFVFFTRQTLMNVDDEGV